MPQFAVLGIDSETNQPLRIGNVERRSGLYILGKPGMGKSALLVNIISQDITNGHGLFFLDPHADAITDLLNRADSGALSSFAKILDPEDERYSFGINLLACRDITSLTERMDTYTRAYNVFYKLWEDEWGPWLQLILQNTLHAFIENPEYTLAEVPLFLNPRNEAFRNHIIGNIKYSPAVVDFWKYEFFERRERDQQERVDAALTRVTTLLTHPYIRHIVGQRTTTVDFDAILKPPKTILLVKLSANLAEDIKRFIGTILISELLHAVRRRPEGEREQFCIFVDEFQNFTGADDFRTLITEGRKFGIATTIAHQERFGQFADNQKLLGATLAAANKILFQLTVKDAEELAPEFAKEATTTEVRLEPIMVISQEPVWDLFRRGHANPRIQEFCYWHIRDYREYLDQLKQRMEKEKLQLMEMQADVGHLRDTGSLARVDEASERLRTDGVSVYNRMQALSQASAALESVASISGEARKHVAELKLLYGYYTQVLEKIHTIDKFLIAVMEGRLTPFSGKELCAEFFIALITADVYVPSRFSNMLYLYLSLRFGDPTKPRKIPGIWDHRARRIEGKDAESKTPPPQTRVLTTSERERLVQAADDHMEELKDPENAARGITLRIVINEIVEICELLTKPENQIKVPSGQYIEKPVSMRLVSDMANEMAQELGSLPRFSAWAKVIDESAGEQVVLKQKIKTLPLPPLQKPPKGDIESHVITNGHSLCKERVQIEEEISQRQERWRRDTPSRRPPAAEEPPRRL